MSMLLEAIKEFPSLLFRGAASVIDPAYKEMKMHWENCDIDKLTMSAMTQTQLESAGVWLPAPQRQRETLRRFKILATIALHFC